MKILVVPDFENRFVEERQFLLKYSFFIFYFSDIVRMIDNVSGNPYRPNYPELAQRK